MPKTTKNDLLEFESRLWNEGFNRVMGLDEVGRGCLSGPVVAAGVILPRGLRIEGINDSKVLSAKRREQLALEIRQNAIFWTVQEVSVEVIDAINILNAAMKAMMACADADGAAPDHLLVDGNRFPASLIPVQLLVKGDSRSQSIAAASILAKVHRDALMERLHQEFPMYAWDQNKGYGTEDHYRALEQHGECHHHRKSFKLRH